MLISCDFDETIYARPKNEPQIGPLKGEPLEGAIEALKTLQAIGNKLYIFTARPDHGRVKAWLKKYGLDIPVSSTKVSSDLFIDNNALRYEGDWEETLDKIEEIFEEDRLS